MSKYMCENKKCPEHHKEVEAVHFGEYRMMTGRTLRCYECGEVLTWLRNV